MEISGTFPPDYDHNHRSITGCMMSVLPCCCSCADRRPQAAAYPVYVDGKGILMQGKRWQRYCRKCHDYWQSLASEPEPLDSIPTPQASTSSTSAQAEMSLPPVRYHNRYRTQSDSPRDSQQRADVAVPSSDITSAAHHPSISSNVPQASTESANREHVYPLGSREDVQQEDYESPLAGMFGRAYGRYREAEAARQEAQAHGYEAVSSWNLQGQFTTVYRPAPNPLIDPAWPYHQPQVGQAQFQDNINFTPGQRVNQTNSHTEEHTMQDGWSSAQRPSSRITGPVVSMARPRFRTNFHRQFYTDNTVRSSLNNPFEHDDDDRINPVDAQQHRPSPTKSEDLKVDLACKICTEQKINTVCMPCMHACMCRWCAAIHKNDCRDYDTGRWSGALWKCPICRKPIQEVKKLYL